MLIDMYYPVPLFLLVDKGGRRLIHFKAVASKCQGSCAIKEKEVKGITNKFVLILTTNLDSTRPTYREEMIWKCIFLSP